jgi:MFS family permease
MTDSNVARATSGDPGAVVPAAAAATTLVFAALGVANASWAARIPQVKAQLGLSTTALGFVLIALALGSMVSLPLAGTIITRYGSRRSLGSAALLVSAGLTAAAIGAELTPAVVFCGLLAMGIGSGLWDVTMNVHAARVERLAGRTMMPRFHAWYSIGTVGGALLGVVMVVLRVPVDVHLVAIAVLAAVVVLLALSRLLPEGTAVPLRKPTSAAPATPRPAPAPRVSLRQLPGLRRRALLIGCLVAAFALAEGSGNDWISVAMISSHHSPAALATATYGAFLAAMTAGRWSGHRLLQRYGRVLTLRCLGLLAIGGLALFIFSGLIVVAVAGAVLWGFGTSLGFPVGTSAAADEPAAAAASVSVVDSVGYLGFLGGPPLIGLLSHHGGVLHALCLVVAALALAVVGAGSVRERAAHAASRS